MASASVGEAPRSYECKTTFRGHEVSILQTFRDKGDDGQDNTGFCVWECSNIAMRYLAKEENLATIMKQADGGVAAAGEGEIDRVGGPRFEDLRLLDLSAGAGLLAIAFAKAGAKNVAASDIPAQLPQLYDNVERAGLELRKWAAGDEKRTGPGGVTVVPLYWGEPLDGLKAAMEGKGEGDGEGEALPPCDIAVASDILFIALRDKRTEELAYTLKNLLLKGVARAVLFGFEERLWREEDEWMREVMGLGLSDDDDDADALADDRRLFRVTELKGKDVTLEFEESLASQGGSSNGHAETEIFNPYLFWECPPVRMFIITLRRSKKS